MKKSRKLVALALAVISVCAMAVPASAKTETPIGQYTEIVHPSSVTYGVLNSNVRVWTNLSITYHYGYAQQNNSVQVLSGYQVGADGDYYVKVYVRNGPLAGITGYVLMRCVNPA